MKDTSAALIGRLGYSCLAVMRVWPNALAQAARVDDVELLTETRTVGLPAAGSLVHSR